MHRYLVYVLALVLLPVSLALADRWPAWYWGVGLFGAMALVRAL